MSCIQQSDWLIILYSFVMNAKFLFLQVRVRVFRSCYSQEFSDADLMLSSQRHGQSHHHDTLPSQLMTSVGFSEVRWLSIDYLIAKYFENGVPTGQDIESYSSA